MQLCCYSKDVLWQWPLTATRLCCAIVCGHRDHSSLFQYLWYIFHLCSKFGEVARADWETSITFLAKKGVKAHPPNFLRRYGKYFQVTVFQESQEPLLSPTTHLPTRVLQVCHNTLLLWAWSAMVDSHVCPPVTCWLSPFIRSVLAPITTLCLPYFLGLNMGSSLWMSHLICVTMGNDTSTLSVPWSVAWGLAGQVLSCARPWVCAWLYL